MARWRRLARRAVRRARGRQPPEADPRLTRLREERDTARRKVARLRKARDGCRERVATLEQELEAARRGPSAERDDLSYLFIVTYGRSGSTLLQGILSSVPGVMIRGENGGAVRALFEFHRTVAGHRDRLSRTEPLPPSHPWWGIDGYPDATALRHIRQLLLDTVLRPGPQTRLVGFKEIDWPTADLPDLLAFLSAVFPGARFVLNTRDLDDVAQSKWWARQPDARERLGTMQTALVTALDACGERAYRVHYDDYVEDPAALRDLFRWLDLPYDEERVRAVMAVRHSY